jgi:hypothetical protein
VEIRQEIRQKNRVICKGNPFLRLAAKKIGTESPVFLQRKKTRPGSGPDFGCAGPRVNRL